MCWPGLPDQMPRAHDGANTYDVYSARAERGVGIWATLRLLNTNTAVQTEPLAPSPRSRRRMTAERAEKDPTVRNGAVVAPLHYTHSKAGSRQPALV